MIVSLEDLHMDFILTTIGLVVLVLSFLFLLAETSQAGKKDTVAPVTIGWVVWVGVASLVSGIPIW